MQDDFRVSSMSPDKNFKDLYINIVRKFAQEAESFNIKIGSLEFWVYHTHRCYEEYGKYGYCVAGTNRIAEDLNVKEKAVKESYLRLAKKGAVISTLCDNRVYRSKTHLYISASKNEHKLDNIKTDRLTLAEKMQIIDKGNYPIIGLDPSAKTDDPSAKTDDPSAKTDHNINNNINNNIVISKDITVPTEQVTFGKPLINNMIAALLKEKNLNALDGAAAKNRQYANHVAKKIKAEFVARRGCEPTDDEIIASMLAIIRSADKYTANKITSFMYIFYNFSALILQNTNNKSKIVTI